MTIPILAQTQEAINGAMNSVSTAAAQNDRWLFIAALTVLLGFAGIVIKWLVSSLETKDTAHALERKELSDKVLAANDRFNNELKAERVEARAQRQADQAAFLESLKEHGEEIDALAAAQKATTTLLTQHVEEVRDKHRIDTKKLVAEELERHGVIVSAT